MKKQNTFIAYILIGIGIYFLLRQFDLPFLNTFYSWPTILMIVGAALLFHSYSVKDHQNLFGGTIVLALGIHFHGLHNYPVWIDHWAVYPLIVGIAFLMRFFQTKRGILQSVILIGLSLFFIFSSELPSWFHQVEKFWPIALIILGIYFLKRK